MSWISIETPEGFKETINLDTIVRVREESRKRLTLVSQFGAEILVKETNELREKFGLPPRDGGNNTDDDGEDAPERGPGTITQEVMGSRDDPAGTEGARETSPEQQIEEHSSGEDTPQDDEGPADGINRDPAMENTATTKPRPETEQKEVNAVQNQANSGQPTTEDMTRIDEVKPGERVAPSPVDHTHGPGDNADPDGHGNQIGKAAAGDVDGDVLGSALDTDRSDEDLQPNVPGEDAKTAESDDKPSSKTTNKGSRRKKKS